MKYGLVLEIQGRKGNVPKEKNRLGLGGHRKKRWPLAMGARKSSHIKEFVFIIIRPLPERQILGLI